MFLALLIHGLKRWNNSKFNLPISNLDALFDTNVVLVIRIITTIGEYDPFITSEVSTFFQTFVNSTETNLSVRTMTSGLDLIGNIKSVRLEIFRNFLEVTLYDSTNTWKRGMSKKNGIKNTALQSVYTYIHVFCMNTHTCKICPILSVHYTCYQREPDNH